MPYHRFKDDEGNEHGSFETFEANVIEIDCRCGVYSCPEANNGDEIFDGICPSCGNEAPAKNTKVKSGGGGRASLAACQRVTHGAPFVLRWGQLPTPSIGKSISNPKHEAHPETRLPWLVVD